MERLRARPRTRRRGDRARGCLRRARPPLEARAAAPTEQLDGRRAAQPRARKPARGGAPPRGGRRRRDRRRRRVAAVPVLVGRRLPDGGRRVDGGAARPPAPSVSAARAAIAAFYVAGATCGTTPVARDHPDARADSGADFAARRRRARRGHGARHRGNRRDQHPRSRSRRRHRWLREGADALPCDQARDGARRWGSSHSAASRCCGGHRGRGRSLPARRIAAHAASGDKFAAHRRDPPPRADAPVRRRGRGARAAVPRRHRGLGRSLRHEEGIAYGLEGLSAIAARGGDAERAGVLAGRPRRDPQARRGVSIAPAFVYHTRYLDDARRCRPGATAIRAARPAARSTAP